LQKKYFVGLDGRVVRVVLGRLEAIDMPASLLFLALIASYGSGGDKNLSFRLYIFLPLGDPLNPFL
jgi:hypothetical protein